MRLSQLLNALRVLKEAGAWDQAVVPAFQYMGTGDKDEEGTGNVPTGTKPQFTERLLRNILPFAASQKIDSEAVAVVGASFSETAPSEENEAAPSNGATAPFTERLLRNILPFAASNRSTPGLLLRIRLFQRFRFLVQDKI